VSRAPGRAEDRSALAVWVATRVGVTVLALAAAWTVGAGTAGQVPSYLSLWDHWDTGLFVKIARFGYAGYPRHYPDKGVVAFFPGEPLVLRVVHAAVPTWVGAALLVSAVAGAVAAVALGRLGAREHGPDVGRRAVLFWTLAPPAVFLYAGYSEALFCAFAVPAWTAARGRDWTRAGLFAGAAAAVRVTGLFLAVALVVEWLLARDGRRRPRAVLALALPFLVLAAYTVYLHHLTGDWLAWSHAQRDVWGRSLTAPWTAWRTTWDAGGDPSAGAAYAWSFRAENVAVVVGVLLSLLLLARRRWAELVYVGGQVVAFATSSFYLSVARSALLWWPLWLLLAEAAQRHRWVTPAYLAVAAPLAAAGVVAFTQGHWVG
jgi:hypothetical protein